MIGILDENRQEIEVLCRRYHVRRLDVFGSAATNDRFNPNRSDLDFLDEFQKTEAMSPADQYFVLLDDLKRLFGRDVDLVTAKALRNPYFIRSVNATRSLVYAA